MKPNANDYAYLVCEVLQVTSTYLRICTHVLEGDLGYSL
jgi:hypothetical protein